MLRSTTPFVLALLLLAGCVQEAAPPMASSSPPTFVWNIETRPYEVLGVSASNVPRLGDQSRNAEAIYPDPDSQANVERALQEIYRELRRDVVESQRDAEFRRISILIYDSRGDERHDPDAFLCRLSLAPEAGQPLPEWPADAVSWQWRDPESRPDVRTRQIEWEYLEILEDINRTVLSPLERPPGMPAAEYREHLERTYKAESDELKRQISEKYDLSVEELEELLDRLLKWKYEGEA